MRIVFSRAGRGGSVATIYRTDGVAVELPFYSRKHQVPHDLVHAVAERELGLSGGLIGSIAGGAMFKGMRVVSGRQRRDPVERSRRVLNQNKRALTTAEVMAGVLHREVNGESAADPAAQARHDWGIVNQGPFPWTDEQILSAIETLRELAAAWERLGPAESLGFSWPDRLISAVPR